MNIDHNSQSIVDDKKLDLLLAQLPQPQYDLDAWLKEDETAEFDRIVRQRRRMTWRWVAAAACLIIIIGIGGMMWPREEPTSQKIQIAKKSQLTQESQIAQEPQLPRMEQPHPAPPLKRPNAKNSHRQKPLLGSVARTSPQNGYLISLPDTLGDGIWQRKENVVTALRMLSECEQAVAHGEQAARNAIIEATFRAMPQPKNVILVTNEAGDYEVIETRNMIDI